MRTPLILTVLILTAARGVAAGVSAVAANNFDANGGRGPSGTTLTQSTGVPTNAASQALWMYYQSAYTQVRNARFRWAQRGIQYDENPGVSVSPALTSSSFENSNVGIYVNVPSDTLYLAGVITCNVTTPIYDYAGYYSGTTTPSANVVNASAMLGGQLETAIAINPANPANAVIVSMQSGILNNQPGILCAYTRDGGASWTTNLIGGTNQSLIPLAWCDPSVAFDQFGNLFLGYLDYPLATNVVVALSTNGGASFLTNVATFTNPYGGQYTYGMDSPRVVAGPVRAGNSSTGSVWVAFDSAGPTGWPDCTNYVSYSTVTGVGPANIGRFSAAQAIPSSAGAIIPNLAVGPNGEVAFSMVLGSSTSSSIYLSVNTNGIYNPQWITPVLAVNANLPQYEKITPDPHRGIWQSGRIAFDLTTNYPPRLYLVFTDYPSGGSTNNTEILFTLSTNYAAASSWTSPVILNDDTNNNTLAHFLPALAVDPVSGNVAVCWYDCRNDPNNVLTQCFATVSRDRGNSFCSKNFQICPGRSNATSVWTMGYGDYTGIAYYGGIFRFVWADNSNNSAVQPPNPNPPNGNGLYPMNVYVSLLGY